MNALVLLIASILFIASLSILVWTRKHIQAIEQKINTQQVSEHVIDEITALNIGSIGLGGRFLKLEKELQALGTRLDEVHSQMQTNTPYGHAINLAQKGSNAEDIMELCHISRNEAELLIMMHRKDQAA
jgi:Protein of unknown function (DUF2802)